MNTVFVSFPFQTEFDKMFDVVRELASRRQLRAVRIDQIPGGPPIVESIHLAIRDARLVIADVTGNNPNVLHEVGVAQALGKPLLLLTRDEPSHAPFNIRGFKMVRYTASGLAALKKHVEQALAEETSPNELLRSMLVPATLGRPTRSSWFVVAASPLSFRRARGRRGGYTTLRRTSSDYVGLRGILQSFGLLFGFDVLPDTLDPDDYDDPVIKESMNLYSIASPKANRWTATILEEYGRRWAPRLEFRADPGSSDLRNVDLSIFCDDTLLRPAGWTTTEKVDRYDSDFGLIVRGPNPYDSERMVAVIAGRSSLGTEAACLAFTDAAAVAVIQKRLSGYGTSLDDHESPFWALVSMQRARDGKEEADKQTLHVERVERFRPRQ